MRIQPRTAAEYARALAGLLPPGAAWQWPEGGFGATLLLATAQELARSEAASQGVLDEAIVVHRPRVMHWMLADYRGVAAAVVAALSERLPRQPFAAGSPAGARLWSQQAAQSTFIVPLVQVDHLVCLPYSAGSPAGHVLWGERGRCLLRVRYFAGVVDPRPLWAALAAFKQAHVMLWFEDITGTGGTEILGEL